MARDRVSGDELKRVMRAKAHHKVEHDRQRGTKLSSAGKQKNGLTPHKMDNMTDPKSMISYEDARGNDPGQSNSQARQLLGGDAHFESFPQQSGYMTERAPKSNARHDLIPEDIGKMGTKKVDNSH